MTRKLGSLQIKVLDFLKAQKTGATMDTIFYHFHNPDGFSPGALQLERSTWTERVYSLEKRGLISKTFDKQRGYVYLLRNASGSQDER